MANDFWSFRGVNKNTLLEYVTPHKICIIILIKEFCFIKQTKNMQKLQLKRVLFQEELKPIYRRDFSMLALHLIQSPDLEYEEFVSTLDSGKYVLLPELVTNFKREVQNLLQRDLGSIMDVLINVERLLIEPSNFEPLINKSSMIGLFLRRVRLFFDKLSFSQTVGMFKAYQNYVQLKPATETKPVSSNNSEAKLHPSSRLSMEMDLSSINEETLSNSPNKSTSNKIIGEVKDEGLIGLWSRRQAELFIAQQAKLLVNNPELALPPQQLQAKIRDVLATNPEHAEAHYLSYLNCLRSKEYCGAMDSLFHYFDRKAPSVYEDESTRCKGLRYAALNLAILQATFNHRNEALSALKEAVTLAHEANDNVCLQHAQAWMYKLTEESKDVLIERSVAKSNELNLNYLSSFGLQSFAQYAAKHGGLPSHVFELLSKSDVLNSQYSMMDLLSLSFAHKSALWSMYGRSDLASLASQQLLHLAASDGIQSSSTYSGEALILAISNMANYFTMQGEYQVAWLLINHGKERVPSSHWWLWSENVLYFTESLHKGLWSNAQAAVQQLATVDKNESLLRQGQLLLAKGDKKGAIEAATQVLSLVNCSMTKIRALHLSAMCNPMASIMSLSEALYVSNFLSLDYWMGLIALQVANIQLDMGLPCQAMKLVDQTLLGVLSHGCYPDMSDSIVLFAKCKVATVATAPFTIRLDVASEALRLLDKAAEYARQIEDYSRLKRIAYLQALLCNNVGMITERNKFAFEFRTLDEQMPIQAPQWTEFLTCPVCCNEFDATQRSPISLACAHTVCKTCLANLHKKQCPFDQTIIKTEVSGLPVNGALLQLVGSPLPDGEDPPACLATLAPDQLEAYAKARKAVEELALYLKPFSSGSGSGVLSRPMQRKLVTLINCQLAEEEGRCRAMRAARSLGDRTVTELILHHQNPQHLSANLWAAVRARGCQFLGPAMQEEVLKLVLLALEDGSALSRKVLVMFVVQRLEPHFPQASKTSIGHVVQLLYRASCFKVSKREGDSSLMQLKEEFRVYEALRREHDAQIVQIATEAGLRIAPDQWSALLYGDTAHKSHMQSIIDKLQSPQSFAQSVQELVIALQRTSDPGNLSVLRPHLELLAGIDPNPEVVAYRMTDVSHGLEACRVVVAGLVEFMRVHGGKGASPAPADTKYKVSLCRDLAHRGTCPRGTNCTFAHSGDELDKFRAKNRKAVNRNTILKEEELPPPDDVIYSNEGSNDYSVFPVNQPFPATHSVYPTATPAYTPDLYNSPTHNVILTPGGAYPEFTSAPLLHQQEPARVTPKHPVWTGRPQNIPSSKRVASSLAVLQHRKQELLNQLERVVARCNNNPVRSDHQGTPTNYSMWHATGIVPAGGSPDTQINNFNTTRPLLYRSDSMMTEEEFIPFDPPVVSKYGPISREGTKLPVANSGNFQEPTTAGLRSPVTWVFNTPQGYPTHLVQPPRDAYSQNLVDPHVFIHYRPTSLPNQDITASKEFIVESQKMKQQLRSLEKKINDLKLATEGAVLTEGEKLSQELQIIEQGIREREKQLRLNHLGGGTTVPCSGDSWAAYRNEDVQYCAQEDSYEAGIANDIRELELRWEFELEEQEKRWSSEEESTKK